MEFAISKCITGAVLARVCEEVDEEMFRICGEYEEPAGRKRHQNIHIKYLIFNLFVIYLGIAFPCCISPNNILCHWAALTDEESKPTQISLGDYLKIELALHIKGCPVMSSATVIVGQDTHPLLSSANDIMKEHIMQVKAGLDSHDVASYLASYIKEKHPEVKFFEGKPLFYLYRRNVSQCRTK